MGADLYIQSVYEQTKNKYEAEFKKWVNIRDNSKISEAKDKAQIQVSRLYDLINGEGYFRDSYNATSIMWRLSISWWQDIIPMLEEGKLSPNKCKILLTLVKSRKVMPVTADWLRHNNCTVDSVDEWNKYYKEKYDRFIEFLKTAIELNEPIDCSL